MAAIILPTNTTGVPGSLLGAPIPRQTHSILINRRGWDEGCQAPPDFEADQRIGML